MVLQASAVAVDLLDDDAELAASLARARRVAVLSAAPAAAGGDDEDVDTDGKSGNVKKEGGVAVGTVPKAAADADDILDLGAKRAQAFLQQAAAVKTEVRSCMHLRAVPETTRGWRR